MKNTFLIIITDDTYLYDQIKFVVSKASKLRYISNNQTKITIDCSFVHYLMKEIFLSKFYRKSFIRHWASNDKLILILAPTEYDLIDYKWNERVYYMVRERCELDHALSWLSTLGGAFSALGDYFPNCADIAGKISINQLRLALRLGDPTIAARCRLYLSLSLIQKKKIKSARKIVFNEYLKAKNDVIVDRRLLNMCRGIWSKLQYEHSFHKNVSKEIKQSVQ